MRLRSLDLFLSLGIAIANVVWVALSMPADPASLSLVGIILAVPLIFVVPGYMLTEVFSPGRSLEPVQRLVFALALSIAMAIFGGFALNQFSAGLRILPWTIWLGVLTTIFTLLAYLRRQRQPQQGEAKNRPQCTGTRVSIATFMLFGMAALVVVLSVFYSVVGAERQPHPGFTNFWVVSATDAGNTCAVSVGVQSFELAPLTYRVVMTANKDQLANWQPFSLIPNQQWTQLEPITVGNSSSIVILVQLYRLDQPQTMYRHVDLTLHVARKGSAMQCSIASAFPFAGIHEVYRWANLSASPGFPG